MKKFLFAAPLLALSATANAAVVYNNGGPNSNGGNETVAWVQAEDFTFGGNTAVNGAGVYLAGYGGIDNWDGQLQYWIFDNAGGAPGSVLQTGGASVSPVDSGTPWCCGGNAHLFAFDFASTFNAVAGATYWLGIHAGAPGNFNRDDIYWVTTAGNGTATGAENSGGNLTGWYKNSNQHAFYLEGSRIAGAIPEPTTWGLMILGFGVIGGGLRRQKVRTRVTVSYA